MKNPEGVRFILQTKQIILTKNTNKKEAYLTQHSTMKNNLRIIIIHLFIEN